MDLLQFFFLGEWGSFLEILEIPDILDKLDY